MRVYLNFEPRSGPYGGANAFLRTLMRALGRHGVTFTSRLDEPVDVALVNALTNDIGLDDVRKLSDRGVPVVHRKTGYRGRGIAELRAEVDGVIEGDRRQIELSPYITHSVFQSEYSRDVFHSSGFAGRFSVIPNGVDTSIFNTIRVRRFRGSRPREWWRPTDPVRLVVSTWSTDPSKGWSEVSRVAERLRDRRDATLTVVGRVPSGCELPATRTLGPRRAEELAEILKRAHVILNLTQWESCSNALIEGLNCGLPAIYLDSGANREVAGEYGVAYEGDIVEALDEIRRRYADIVARLPENPYRIEPVAARYLAVLASVAAGDELDVPDVAKPA